MPKLQLQTESGLSWKAVQSYQNSPDLERSEKDCPVYLHRKGCDMKCNYECNGDKGTKIATDICTEECYFDEDEFPV